MSSRFRLSLGRYLLLAVFASSPAAAQYMYLDANGDGVHTAADTFRGSGSTSFDVYITTDKNRDGSAAVCLTSPGTGISIGSYEFVLRAGNGEVAWSNFLNRATSMGIQFGVASSSTEFYAGFGGLGLNPPGTYRLASLVGTPTSGTPSIAIVTDGPTLTRTLPTPPVTEFGSYCPGFDYDNTLKLGQDWFDTDGLPYDATPPPNSPPVLAPIASANALVGDRIWIALHATDADAQPLQFSLATGPAYAEVTTEEQGIGSATGRLHVTPRKGDTGPSSAMVSVSDGVAAASQSVPILVTGAPNHAPRFDLAAKVVLPAGGVRSLALWGYDLDGDDVSFSLDSGPAFVSLTSRAAHAGGANGRLRIAPSLCDQGVSNVVVALSDGVTRFTRTIQLDVRAVAPPPATTQVVLPTREYPGGIAAGDLDGNGLADIVVANETGRSVSVFRALGGGAFSPERTVPVGLSASSVALADFDEDGKLDAAVSCRWPNDVEILHGRGDGSFDVGPKYATNWRPEIVLAVDATQDGHLDLVVANGSSSSISVLAGHGDGTFSPQDSTRVDGSPYGVAVDDWDRDGRLDAVSGNATQGTISFLRGYGDGTYREHVDTPIAPSIFSVATGDWDLDGNPDLALVNYRGSLVVVRGDGAGGFTTTEEHDGFTAPQTVTAADMNLDGLDDLIVCDVLGKAAQVFLGRGDGTFAAGERFAMPIGAWGAAVGDMNGDAVPDLALSDSEYGAVIVRFEARPPAVGGAARAFVAGGHRPVIANAGGGPYCVRLQPVENAFSLDELDLTSFRLGLAGGGSGERIEAIQGKPLVVADTDHDSADEIAVCFAQTDLSRLVGGVTGRRTVEFRLEGALLDGQPLCAPLLLDVQGPSQGPPQVSVHPNPLNPAGTISLTTSRPGPLSVRVYDLSGRLVRVLADRAAAPAGDHSIRIDGRNRTGGDLASGVYFYRVESADGVSEGRFTILR